MKYTVIGIIKRDGKKLKIGSAAEFDEVEGARLVRDGYLAVIPAGADKDKKADKDPARKDGGK